MFILCWSTDEYVSPDADQTLEYRCTCNCIWIKGKIGFVCFFVVFFLLLFLKKKNNKQTRTCIVLYFLILLVPWDGCASWLWHCLFLYNETHIMFLVRDVYRDWALFWESMSLFFFFFFFFFLFFFFSNGTIRHLGRPTSRSTLVLIIV